MKVLLTTFNSSYIHKNLALRWIYVAKPKDIVASIKEYTIKDEVVDVVQYIIDNNFDVVGLSVYIWNVKESIELIKSLKKVKPDIKIVLGGPEVTYENDEYFDYPIDGIVLGEGERVFWDYIINNDTTYVKEAKSEFKPIKKEDVSYLETLDSPYTLDIDVDNFSNQYLYVEASRGCPFRCSYCLSSLDNNVRFFSLEYLESLFESVKDYKINQVKFLDRTFNAHRKRTFALYEILEKYQNIESFQVEIVADKLDDELINLIIDKKNRYRFRYEVGIQSFNQKTLQSVDRSQNNEKLKAVLLKLLENEVVVHADLIAGLPYEGLESFRSSFNELANLYPTELQLGILKLLKGTKMKDEALKLNYLYNLEAPYEVYKTPWLNRSEMDEIVIAASGVDRSLNRNLLEISVKYLNENVYKNDLYNLYYELGLIFEKLGIKYQKYDLFIEVYNKFKNKIDENILKSILSIDYFKNEKQKPKLLFKAENVKEINKRIVQAGYFSTDEVYRYGRVFVDYRKEDQIIFNLFNKHQSECSQYLINFKENTCQKIS